METLAVGTSLDAALRQFEATEANLAKLERIWHRIQELTPDGIGFCDTSPEAIAFENACRAFREILRQMPAIDGFRISDELVELDDLAQRRLDAQMVDEPECYYSVENSAIAQGPVLRDYRFRFNSKRRQLVRGAIIDVTAAIGREIENLQADLPTIEDKHPIEYERLDVLKDLVRQLSLLLGNSFPSPKRISDLGRHLHFSMKCDLIDIVENDWPSIESHISQIMCRDDEPLPVETDDLASLSTESPAGPVATALAWDGLSPEEFERLVFNLISDASGYENPKWLTRTNAPDRGRDLSVERVHCDELSGTSRKSVIIQCKHWLSNSVSLKEVSQSRDQMKLHNIPVDVLIMVTSGRFTADAVEFVNRHNLEKNAPTIDLWAESHLERLLARRPHLVAEFRLR